MGCYLSVPNSCDPVTCFSTYRNGKRGKNKQNLSRSSSVYLSLSKRRRGRQPESLARRTGLLVADALTNIEKAHTFRHGECYLCNYKRKTSNGVCIHREIFTSVKPGFYSTYYRKGTNHSLNGCGKGYKCRNKLSKSSTRSVASDKRSIRSISAFPKDRPTPELGIKPQIEFASRIRSRLSVYDETTQSTSSTGECSSSHYYEIPLGTVTPPEQIYETIDEIDYLDGESISIDLIGQPIRENNSPSEIQPNYVLHREGNCKLSSEEERTTPTGGFSPNYDNISSIGNWQEVRRTKMSANAHMENDVTPVYLAAQEGHLEVLQYLVEEAGGQLTLSAKDGMAPVHAAAQMGCLSCLRWMVKSKGVDVNSKDDDGATPLHFAASRGHRDCVSWLLKHNAVIILDNFGKSPINDAADNNHIEVLQLLIEHGSLQDSAAESDGSDCSSGLVPCSCRAKSQQLRKGSDGSVSDTCSSCHSDCNSGNSSDSGLHQESFYQHSKTSKLTETNGNSHNGVKKNKRIAPKPAKEECQDPIPRHLEFNPLTDLKEASKRHSKKRQDGIKEENEPFYLHKPEEVIYHRARELFDDNDSSHSTKSNTSSSPSSRTTTELDVVSKSKSTSCQKEAGQRQESVEIKTEIKRPTYSSSSDGSVSELSSTSESFYEDLNKEPTPDHASKQNGSTQSDEEEQYEKQKKLLQGLDDLIAGYEDELNAENGGSAYSSFDEELPASNIPPIPPPLPTSILQSVNKKKIGILVDPHNDVPPADFKQKVRRSISLPSDISDSEYSESPLISEGKSVSFVEPKLHKQNGHFSLNTADFHRSMTDFPDQPSSFTLPSIPEVEEEGKVQVIPLPPPLPPVFQPATNSSSKSSPSVTKSQNSKNPTMPSISVSDLKSVQLRKTENKLTKTNSVPLKINSETNIMSSKTELIAELKLGVDIDGIKKLKHEKVKENSNILKKEKDDMRKKFSFQNFVEKVPEVDISGNPIPDWKRQMLAKKAAERAQKEAEEERLQQLEEKRIRSIPEWKRHLLAKKEEDKHRKHLIVQGIGTHLRTLQPTAVVKL